MTHVNLKDALISRIGFRQEAGLGFTLDAPNLASESGLKFQDDNSFVTLANVKAFMEPIPVDDVAFNAFLTVLRDRTVMGVITDVIETPEVPDGLITGRENIFDSAILKKMAITVGEIVLASKRSNLEERTAKEFMQRLFFELNGNEGNPQMPKFNGLRTRYEQEVRRLKGLLGHRKSLSTTTYKVLDNYDDAVKL